MHVNWVDIVLLLVIALSAFAGYQRGLILSLLDMSRWIGSWLLGLFLYKPLADGLGYITDLTETYRSPIAFLAIVIIAGVAIQAIGWQIVKRISPETHRSRLNRIFGAFPGAVNGIVMAAIVSALLFALPLSDSASEAVQNSRVADGFAVVTDQIENLLNPIFEPAIRQSLNRLTTIEPGSDELVELPFKVANSKPAPALEEQMLDLLNQERTSRGLKALAADPELVPVARAHSEDMFQRGYFSHYTPEGKDPFQRMKDADITYRIAGENLALAPTLQIAHTGLMDSPGHRENILNPKFGRVGIGIMDGGRRGIMVSQEFRN